MKKNQLELLAPAGSYDIFRAVLNAGADAVYVGGGQFGARAYANNFSEEELLRAIDEAHIHGKQLYLTVNTLLKEEELEAQLYDYLRPYYEQGLDLSLIHISEPTRRTPISYAVFCLKKKKEKKKKKKIR